MLFLEKPAEQGGKMWRKDHKTPDQYKLTDLEYEKEQPYEIDLAPLLQRFTKRAAAAGKRFFYKVHIARGHGTLIRNKGGGTEIYRDAEYTIVLSTMATKKWLRWFLPSALIPSKYLYEQAVACI